MSIWRLVRRLDHFQSSARATSSARNAIGFNIPRTGTAGNRADRRPSYQIIFSFLFFICIKSSVALLSALMPRESAVEAVTRATSCKRAARHGDRQGPQ